MTRYRFLKDGSGEEYLEVTERGLQLLGQPLLNKGLAFPEDERRLLSLDGLMPPSVATMEQQVAQAYECYLRCRSPRERRAFLRSLQDFDEVLFYAVLLGHLEEMMPVVYTPTVGDACREYGHRVGPPRGVFLSPCNIDRAEGVLGSLRDRGIRLIVVTDGEAVLGIGDQGVGGMEVSISKVALYVAAAGLHPAACLPVALDVGTDNEALLRDPFYPGVRRERLRGEAYTAFVERFVTAVKRALPGALIQWEDFSKQNAFDLLERFQDEVPSFNDDIQGTGAVVLAGTLAALRLTGQRLEDQTFVVLGAGAAGGGVARQMSLALQGRGLSADEVGRRLFVLDSRGLVLRGRRGLEPYKEEFATDLAVVQGWQVTVPEHITLQEVVHHCRPTVLYGLSKTPGSFTREVVETMSRYCERPVIFSLSNPTSMAEARPADLYEWSRGRAIVAAGSPFGDVVCGGRRFRVGQGNNALVFPGVGLGALAVNARRVTANMLTAAAEALARFVTLDDLRSNSVYPPMGKLRAVSRGLAVAVAEQALADEAASAPADGDVEEAVSRGMWEPRYVRYRAA